MHIVLIGAHPDDETHASGTIAKYVDRGHKATIVLATRGGRGHWKIPSEELERIRTEEMMRAAEVLGAEVVFLDYKDAEVPVSDEIRENLVDVVRRLEPDIVLTFHPMEWRDDHRRIGLAASDACFKAGLPLVETSLPAHRPIPSIYYFGSTMVPLDPDIYIDITEYMDAKVETFRQHRSQWVRWDIDEDDSTRPLDEAVEMLIHGARQKGVESGVRYAEAFTSQRRRKRALDLFPD